MENFSKAKKIENIIVLCLLAFVGVLIVAITSIVTVGGAKREVAAYDKLIEELSAEKASLEKDLDTIENDPTYLEEQARGDLGMIKQGEKIFYFKK